jgi:hypothetical protein
MRRRAIAGIRSLALGLLGLSGCRADPSPAPMRRIADRPLMLVSRTDVEPLRSIQPPAKAPPSHARDPFAFGSQQPASSRRGGPLAPLPPPEGLPALPLPLARPSIRLLGIATGRETPPVRMAILSVAGDLVLAHVGDAIAGRYTLTKIGEEGVELRDTATNDSLTIALP